MSVYFTGSSPNQHSDSSPQNPASPPNLLAPQLTAAPASLPLPSKSCAGTRTGQPTPHQPIYRSPFNPGLPQAQNPLLIQQYQPPAMTALHSHSPPSPSAAADSYIARTGSESPENPHTSDIEHRPQARSRQHSPCGPEHSDLLDDAHSLQTISPPPSAPPSMFSSTSRPFAQHSDQLADSSSRQTQ
jgi:hypothetical protein